MAAPTSPFDLDTTASNNQPPASEGLSSGDDQIRALAACIKQLVVKGADIASAGTITPAATASFFDVTGTTTITAISSSASWDGRVVWLQFDGALTLTHSSTLQLPGNANITTAAGDIAAFYQETSGTWRCCAFLRDSGAWLGDKWSINSSGFLLNSGNTQPMFRATRSSLQTSGSVWIFDTEITDRGGIYNNTTGVLTVPTGANGVWLISVSGLVSTASTSITRTISVHVNGSAVQTIYLYLNSGSAGDGGFSMSFPIVLTAGDTVDVRPSVAFDGTNAFVASTLSVFSGVLLG